VPILGANKFWATCTKKQPRKLIYVHFLTENGFLQCSFNSIEIEYSCQKLTDPSLT
jgi:hypothetical protein